MVEKQLTDYYLKKYKDKTLLVYVNKDVSTEYFGKILSDVKLLISKNIKCILCFQNHNYESYVWLEKEVLINRQLTSVIQEYKSDISEVILVWKDDLIDEDNKFISLLLRSNLKEIQSWNNNIINSNSRIFEDIDKSLEFIPKIVLTNPEWILKEILEWKWSWTMIMDNLHLVFEPLNKSDRRLFLWVYKEYVEKWNFKNRSLSELKSVIRNHYVIRIGESIIGWVSLLPNWDYFELCNFWSGYKWWWIGSKILSCSLDVANEKNKKIFAFTKNKQEDWEAIDLFIKMWFIDYGNVNSNKSNMLLDWDIRKVIEKYDTTQRNPHLLILNKFL